jgi:hypothetical protein
MIFKLLLTVWNILYVQLGIKSEHLYSIHILLPLAFTNELNVAQKEKHIDE